jgi:hypothetical protein
MNISGRRSRLIIAFLVASALVISGMLLWRHAASSPAVRFSVRPSTLTADIYQLNLSIAEDTDGKRVRSVHNGQQVRLRKGAYYAIVKDAHYDPSHIAFDVTDSTTTVTINPSYSASYLSQLLKKERASLAEVITAKYPAVATDFTLVSGKLYLDGTWYGAKVMKTAVSRSTEGNDVYSLVLHKVNGTWQFAATPQIVLTAPENPGIPQSILDDLSEQ